MGDEEFAPLTHDVLRKCLSGIETVVGGGGFAFTKLDCSNKELTELGNKIQNYEHLRHVVLSNNKFTDLSAVTKLPHVLHLKADHNEVAAFDCEDAHMPWCQRLDLSENKLVALPLLKPLERLRFATLSSNSIAELAKFGGHPNIEELDLRKNQLTALEGLGQLPKLRRLFLSENELPNLVGLDAPALDVLEVEANKLENLEGIAGVPALKELNIRGNQLGATKEEGAEGLDPVQDLMKLGSDTPELEGLKISGNPVADGFGDEAKVELLICAPQLLRLEDEALTDEERQAAQDLEKVRIEEAEKEAEAARQREIEAREAEAAAAAAAAAGDDGDGGGDDA